MDDGWWPQLFTSAEWAWQRRFAVRGKPPDASVPLSGVDFAAGALADPSIADRLESDGVDLALLENALAHAVGRPLDADVLRRDSGGVAFRLGAAAVSIDHVWITLLRLPEVADATSPVGLYADGDRWGVSGWASVLTGVTVALRYGWPSGRPKREAIVVEDHDTVTREFVFDLLREEAQLTAVAALRAIRRIERSKEAVVFVGSPAQLESRWPRVVARIGESRSPLRVRREPRW